MATQAIALSAPDALNRLNTIVTQYCQSQIFFTACKLGIFEQLAAGPATADALAQRLGLHPDASMRLLVALQQQGLLERDGDTFSNAPLGAYLTSGARVPMTPLTIWGGLFGPVWDCLDSAVREGSPRWQEAFGTSQSETFANLYKDPMGLRGFCGLMSAYSIPQGQVLAGAFDFTPHHCILDVAGGVGGLIIELGHRYPHLRGMVMDLPPVCALADEAIAAAGLSSRYQSRVCDLFEGPYPAGADVISLSWVLHDWDDDNCRRILRNCYDALPAGGVVLITESVLNDDRSGTPFAVLMSLHMLLLCEPGARERTTSEYRTLLEETGFTLERMVRLDAPRDLVVARKK